MPEEGGPVTNTPGVIEVYILPRGMQEVLADLQDGDRTIMNGIRDKLQDPDLTEASKTGRMNPGVT